jgi:hypothetical protein
VRRDFLRLAKDGEAFIISSVSQTVVSSTAMATMARG